MTDDDTPAFATAVLVNTGTLSPMWMRAFSLFFTRMRGFASRFVRPTVARRFMTSAGFAMLKYIGPSIGWFVVAVVVVAPVTPRAESDTLPGQFTPRSWRRVRAISSTSTSSITSGSARSSVRTRWSAMRTTSGVSRITMRFSFSSTKTSCARVSVFTITAACFTSALAR